MSKIKLFFFKKKDWAEKHNIFLVYFSLIRYNAIIIVKVWGKLLGHLCPAGFVEYKFSILSGQTGWVLWQQVESLNNCFFDPVF